MHIPLISEYKASFIARRLITTFLGGPRIILASKTTCFAILVQATLFLLPWAISQILNIFIDNKEINFSTAMYISGCIMGTIVFILHVVNYVFQRETKVVSKITKQNHLFEDDEIELSTFCGLETFKFIFQRKSNWPRIISYCLISAFICAISLNYLRISTLNKWWKNQAIAACIHGFGWFTVCISQYPLTATNPPEPAIFSNNGNSFVGATFRPFYICCLLGIHCLTWKYENWKEVDEYLHIVFILMPLFWILGILPPQDALLLWAGEQILCLGFGGSATATSWWLMLTLSLSVSLAFLVHYLQNWMAVCIISACFGYVLSVNLEPWVIHFMKIIFPCLRYKTFIDHANTMEQTKLSYTTVRHFLFHFGMVVMTGIAASISCFIRITSEIHSIVWTASGCLTITLLTILWLFEQFQRVYLCRGVMRNYFYHSTSNSMSEFSNKRNKSVTSNYTRMIFQLVMPFTMIFIVSSCGQQTLYNKKSPLSSISIVRAFRMIWQHTENSYLDMSLVYLISESTMLFDHAIPLTISLFIAGLIRHRLIDAWKKLYVIAIIVFTSVSNKKQRLRYSWLLLGLDVIFLPILLAFAVLSVGLFAPLLPLFTLPVFIVGFPRPVKFWPGQVGKSAGDVLDAVYYQQMIPSLINGLQQALHIGSLGTICDGDYFLARFQDRLLWMLVLERGFGYCKMSIKGLELQETSCHAVEALQVDEMFEQAFDKKQDNKQKSCINRNAFHTLTPYGIIAIKTYSDARNVLTGIIHSIETLTEIKEKFPKVLTWVLVHSVVMHKYKVKRKAQIGISDIHPKNEVYTKNYTEIPKTSRTYKEFQSFETHKFEQNISSFNETWTDTIHPSSVLSSWPDDDDPLEDDKGLFPSPINAEQRKSVRDQLLMKHVEMTIPGVVQDCGEIQRKIDYNNDHKKFTNCDFISTSPLSLPKDWTLWPTNISFCNLKCPLFSKHWFSQVVKWIAKDVNNLKEKKDLSEESLATTYEKLVTLCYHALNLDDSLRPDIVHKTFYGIFPSSLLQEWIDRCKELRQMVLTAYRYTVKLALDEYIIGPISSDEELNECLHDYSKLWHIGIDGDKQWRIAVLNQCPYLFSIGFDEIKSVYTSHLLSLQEQPLYIGSLNSALVQSIWSSLCIELLYLTNDDEERYSIQAEPTILRNLTVQAADPPLGYPVYSSKPITLSTLTLLSQIK